MMRKIIFLFLSVALNTFAIDTTDRITIRYSTEESEELILNSPSEGCYFTVCLEGSQLYTAYTMDIHLPDGMSVMTDEEGAYMIWSTAWPTQKSDFYPSTKKGSGKNVSYEYSHNFGFNITSDNVIHVACFSIQSENFLGSSGDLFEVYIKASSYMKPGDVDVVIDKVVLTANEDTQGDGIYHAVTYKPTVESGGTISDVSGACTMPFNVSRTNHWSTCVLPFSCDVPDGVTAYSASGCDDENLLLKKAERFEAYTPYVLYSESGYSGTVSGTVDPAAYPEEGYVTDGYLYGAIAPQQITDGFVMQKLDGEVKFYICNGGVYNIPAGKCWLTVPDNVGVKGFNFVLDDAEDAITRIEGHVAAGELFDLTGRRVKNPKKGIYVENGKKVLK